MKELIKKVRKFWYKHRGYKIEHCRLVGDMIQLTRLCKKDQVLAECWIKSDQNVYVYNFEFSLKNDCKIAKKFVEEQRNAFNLLRDFCKHA